jgi:hypothetical protein
MVFWRSKVVTKKQILNNLIKMGRYARLLMWMRDENYPYHEIDFALDVARMYVLEKFYKNLPVKPREMCGEQRIILILDEFATKW